MTVPPPAATPAPPSADARDRGRSYPTRPVLAASLAVFRQGRVLLARRAAPPLAGLFTLPGGGVEVGETLAEAALREMREEVAVDARILAFNRHVEVVQRDAAGLVESHYVIASFVGTWLAGEGTVGPEASAVVWATRDDLDRLAITDHLIPLLESAWRMVEADRRPC